MITGQSLHSVPNRDLVPTAWRASTPGLAAIAVFSVFINLARLAPPIFVLQALDRVISSRSVETLIMLVIVAVCALVAGLCLEIVRRRMFTHWGGWIERTFGPRLALVGVVQRPDGQRIKASSYVRDVSTIRSFVSSQALLHWIDLVWTPAFVFVVYLIHPMLASLALIWIAVGLVIGMLHERSTRDPRAASRSATASNRGLIESVERHEETVDMLGMGRNLVERWTKTTERRLDESERMRGRTIYAEAVLRFLRHCLRIGMIGVGIVLILDGQLTVGGAIAASVLGRIAYSFVEKAMMRWRDGSNAVTAYRRIRDVLSDTAEPEVSVPSDTLAAPLRLQSVNYRYPHEAASVLRGLSLEIQPGQVLSVSGPAASGKTTLCRLFCGRLEPRGGKVLLGDMDVARMPADCAEQTIGFLPQHVRLFSGTVRENIGRMGDGNIDVVVEAAKLAGVHDAIVRLPKGYDTVVSDEETILSAGLRKGIGLARAVFGWPHLIVLDEPEHHLDRQGRQALLAAIQTLRAQGSIIVLTSQSRKFNEIADQVVTLKANAPTISKSSRTITVAATETTPRKSARSRARKDPAQQKLTK